MCTAAFLHCEPNHDSETRSHDPTGGSRPSEEVSTEEGKDALASCFGVGIGYGQLGKVEHMRHDMNDGPYDDRPCRGLVESDVLVKGNEVVERGPAQEGYKVPTNGKEDEDNIYMENQGGSTSNSWK
jgi:hypothetical protein